MTKTAEKKSITTNQIFAFGLDDSGKPRGARFLQGVKDDALAVLREMRCQIVPDNVDAFSGLAINLPIGRIYASGKAFIPNIRRDLYEKLLAAKPQPAEGQTETVLTPAVEENSDAKEATVVKEVPAEVACVSPITSGLPRSWEAIGVGHMVLVHCGPDNGWWEAVVVVRDGEILTLRYRDYPKDPLINRHINSVALVNPGLA